MKLKKGNEVWVKIPTTAFIKRINKRYGYTLEIECQKCHTKQEISYFGDNEVIKVGKEPSL